MALALGVDLGTQSLKVLVYDPENKKVLSRGSSPCAAPDVPRPGAAEQNPADWWRAFESAMAEALAHQNVDPAAIRAIGVSGQQHGLVALDEGDEVLRPAKLWCDAEAVEEAAALSKICGRLVPPGHTAPKLIWMKRHEPELFGRLQRVCLPHDWLNLRLTGAWGTDPGDASGNGFYDPAAEALDSAAVAWVDPGLEEKLPPINPPDAWHGTLLDQVADGLGLPEGIRVSVGSGDNMMSALGAGASRDGVMVASLGTSGTLFGRAPGPAPRDGGGVSAFRDATGAWLPLHCIQDCTLVVNEVAEKCGMDHSSLTALAAEEKSGATSACDPGPAKAYLDALFAVSFALHAGAAHLENWGLHCQELRVVGGGARNPLWCRILADLFEAPVVVPEEADTAALGAAIQAVAAGADDFLGTVQAHASPVGKPIEPNPG